MISKSSQIVLSLKSAAAVGLVLMAFAGQAQAGECPAGQMAQDALTTGEMMPKDVTDEVLSAIDLSARGDAWKGSQLRLRKLVVMPGGVVPWHSHETRPANIVVVSGAITEYRSNCKVPIEHKAGDVAAEFGALSHWWKNNGSEPAVLYSSDILAPAEPVDGAM